MVTYVATLDVPRHIVEHLAKLLASHLHLHADTQTYNALLRGVRALGEQTAAELEERWRALKRITLSPCRIGDIARAALVLNMIWK